MALGIISSMKKITRGRSAFMPACIAAFLLFLSSGASAGVKTDECLDCHEGYKNYSHAGISCADCHSTITDLPHADKLPKPACAACHEKTVNKYNRSIHHEKGLACDACHRVHFLERKKNIVSPVTRRPSIKPCLPPGSTWVPSNVQPVTGNRRREASACG